MKLPKLTSTILFVISMSFFNVYAAFDLEKLDILCEHISSNKNQCLQEVKYLKITKKKNTTLNYCVRNTDELSSFTSCLKKNTNTLLFLKYKKNKEPSVVKLDKIKKEMISKCKNNSVFEDCLVNGSILIEKSKNPFNWIENHCARENEEYTKFSYCTKDLNQKASETKGVLSKTVVLNEMTSKIINLFKQKRFSYISQAFTVCNEKYGANNIGYKCVEDLISPIQKELIYLKMETIPCLKLDKLSDFMVCLKK